jgi:ATP-dependent helicase/nuclease subunit B
MSDPQAGKTPATALDEFCAEHLLDEKWLLAPSLRIGQQWLESALRCTGRMANLHVVTPVALAVELAEPGLSARKLALAGPSIGWLLTHTLCRQLVQRRGSYFAQAATQPTFYQSLYASLCDLRMAAVEPSQIQAEQLETPNKADDLSWLLGAYAEQLAAHHLIDTAGVLRMAIDELSAPGGHQRRQHRLLLVPDLFSAAGLEQSFLRRLPAGAVHAVTIRHAAEAPRPNVQLLQWLPRVAEAPRPSDEQSVTIFRAVGECNEVREVLRRCLTSELPLDEVEILYSDAETYAPLLYQVARRLTDDASLPDGVPITFAEGIPAILSRPGRALECWLRWIDSGFPQPLLVGMLGDG